MSGSLLRNLKYFEDLCGNEFKKMIFITTMWDQTEQAQGEKHEKQLRDEYWKPILEMGSSTRRFLHERSSAFDVLSPYFDEINSKSFNRLQVEVRNIALKLLLLGDGQRLSVELKRAISHRQETLERIRAELRKPSLNEAEIGGLIDSYEKGFEELSRVAAELERLEIETSKHFKRVVWRMKWDQVIRFVCLISSWYFISWFPQSLSSREDGVRREYRRGSWGAGELDPSRGEGPYRVGARNLRRSR